MFPINLSYYQIDHPFKTKVCQKTGEMQTIEKNKKSR